MAKQKTKGLYVVVETQEDKFYQVSLTEEEGEWVMGLLLKLHNGKVKCCKDELGLERKNGQTHTEGR